MTFDRVMAFTALLRGRGFEVYHQETSPGGTFIQHFRNPRTRLQVGVSVDLGRWGHLSFSYLDEEKPRRPQDGDPEVMALVRAFLGEECRGPLTAFGDEVAHFVDASFPWEAAMGRGRYYTDE